MSGFNGPHACIYPDLTTPFTSAHGLMIEQSGWASFGLVRNATKYLTMIEETGDLLHLSLP